MESVSSSTCNSRRSSSWQLKLTEESPVEDSDANDEHNLAISRIRLDFPDPDGPQTRIGGGCGSLAMAIAIRDIFLTVVLVGMKERSELDIICWDASSDWHQW